MLKQFYPEELERVEAQWPRVRFFGRVVDRLDQLVYPADIYVPYKPDGEAQKRNGVKTVRLTDEQVNMPIAELLEAGTLEEQDTYRTKRPHPLAHPPGFMEEDEPQDWHPSEWWLQKTKLLDEAED